MQSTHRTPQAVAEARDAWSTGVETRIEQYLYYEDHEETHLVELRELQFRQGWEYDVSVRRIDGYDQYQTITEKYDSETTLFELRIDTEDAANAVAAEAMAYLEETTTFDADELETRLSKEVFA